MGVGVDVDVDGSTAGPARSSSSSNPGHRGNNERSGYNARVAVEISEGVP